MKKIVFTNNYNLYKESEYFERNDIMIFTDSVHFYLLYPKSILIENIIDLDKLTNELKKNYGKIVKINRRISSIYFNELRVLYNKIFIFYIKFVLKYKYFIDYLNNQYQKYKLILLMGDCEKIKFSGYYFNRYSNLYKLFFENDGYQIEIKKCNNFEENIPYKYPSFFYRIKTIFRKNEKIVLYNFLKKFIKKERKYKVGIYKTNETIQEIEAYLFFKKIGFKKIKFKIDEKTDLDYDKHKLYEILALCEDKNIKKILELLFNNIIPKLLFQKKYFEKFNYEKLPKLIITHSLGIDDAFFYFYYNKFGGKIIDITHMSYNGFMDIKKYIDAKEYFYEFNFCDEAFVKNRMDKEAIKKLFPNKKLKVIYNPKEIRLNKKIDKNKKKIDILYISSIIYNHPTTTYKHDLQLLNYENDLKTIFKNIKNNNIFIKPYPTKFLVDEYPINDGFKYVKYYDFRYLREKYDLFIFDRFIGASTPIWILGTNIPCIYIYDENFEKLDSKIYEMIKKSIIMIEISDKDWQQKLENILNMPYQDILKIWQKKEEYRKKYDEYLVGRKYIAGELAIKYLEEIIKK